MSCPANSRLPKVWLSKILASESTCILWRSIASGIGFQSDRNAPAGVWWVAGPIVWQLQAASRYSTQSARISGATSANDKGHTAHQELSLACCVFADCAYMDEQVELAGYM